MHLNRRQFLTRHGLTCGAIGLNLFSPGFLVRQLLAADPNSDKKLIFIFQRGGNDGINTVIPRGDADYNTSTRPTLFIPESQGLDTGNGFAQLHPQLQPLMEIYNHSALNGQSGPGNLALLHRIGYPSQSRSHFDSQQFWETGRPGDTSIDEGLFYRHLENSPSIGGDPSGFLAAGISSSQLDALKGANPIPNFRRAEDFRFRGNATDAVKFLGESPTQPDGDDGTGILGLYGTAAGTRGKPYENLVRETGRLLGATMGTLQAAVARGAYTPENGAVYPNTSFGRKLTEAAMLLKRTPVRVLGMNIGGWDLHSGQGQINGQHGQLLYELALGIRALYRDLQDQWSQILVVTMTEFGRTSAENGSRGTDHAASSVMFAAGGGVKGGVYNCDATTWRRGDMFTSSDRYLRRRTDFRSVFGEIFTRHFSDPTSILDKAMPGYTADSVRNPAEFRPLNFL